jgi:hypothetical protein
MARVARKVSDRKILKLIRSLWVPDSRPLR